ncbi:nucleotidyltransferase family protein [Arthrobacter sp. zg-Y820]|nr:nucleotidyltransferase family protein [Arthrobacter sp. zg-Y820]
MGVRVEIRNEARVHLWYGEHFGVPAVPFTPTTDDDGGLRSYAPRGYRDLFDRRIVPNPVLSPRRVYEDKTRRWAAEWPALEVVPWPEAPRH